MIISSGYDTTAVTGGQLDNPSHPLGPNHVNTPGVSVRAQASDGQLHLNNASYASNVGKVGLNLAKGPMVCYHAVVFQTDPSISAPIAGTLLETALANGNLQGSLNGPHPVWDVLDRMFGVFGADSLRERAVLGTLTYPYIQSYLINNWPLFTARYQETVTAGTTLLGVLPWRDPVTTRHEPFYPVEAFHGVQTHGNTDHFEFGIFLDETGILTESNAATSARTRGVLDNMNTLCSTRTLSNHWVGQSTGRGVSAAGISESAYQENIYHGTCHHVHPGTTHLEVNSDIQTLYIPYVRGEDQSWQPSTEPAHWTTTFMSNIHRSLDALRLRPADPSYDYWLAQRSFTTHNATSISFKVGSRSGGDAVAFAQTTFAQAGTSSTREITWSMYSNTTSVLCEVQRGTVPAKYQITPVFVAKDMIHLTVADNSLSSVSTGFDTVVTAQYPVGRTLKSNNTHQITVPVTLNATPYTIDLIFCLGPLNGSRIIELADVAGTALINYLASTQSSRDTLSGTAAQPLGTQCDIRYGWLTRERAAHRLPEILLTIQ